VITVRYPIDAGADSHPAVGVFIRDPVKEDPDLVSYQKAQTIADGHVICLEIPFLTLAHALELGYRLLN
jgi:hypothetical protein